LLFFSSCKEKTKAPSFYYFELLSLEGNTVAFGEDIKLKVNLLNASEEDVASYKVFVDNKLAEAEVKQSSITIPTSTLQLGVKKVYLKATFTDEKTLTKSRNITILSDRSPQKLSYTIVNVFPHDKKSYTQGLEFSNDVLYESAGKYGVSSLRKTDFRTAKVLQSIPLSKNYFGEGITFFNDLIYQLTWREMTCFVYNKSDFSLLKTFQYPKRIQGWGICSSRDELIMSDGTEYLHIMNPSNFSEKRTVQVYDDKGPIQLLNELEYVNGNIFANVYTTDSIVVINPKLGRVEGVLDLSRLLKPEDMHSEIDVLNGIAYHKKRGTYFVTGKNWPKMYELKID
ncbi:MAG: glutaminyl-peptide cyclotransferase, partial [Cyclobacteriaceae bacterium]